MNCLSCSKDFLIIKRVGGMNRSFCYECLPAGLSKSQRTKLRCTLLLNKIQKYKEGIGCSICGFNLHGCALDWHHEVEEDKINNLADMVKNSWSKYLEEVNKCILLCSNCHRIHHHRSVIT